MFFFVEVKRSRIPKEFIILLFLALGAVSNPSISRDRCASDLAQSVNSFPSFDPNHCPPAEEPVFELKQDYPAGFEPENYPWTDIDFKEESEKYADSVLQYCLEGNIESDFNLHGNKVRDWYHAPWLHDSNQGQCGNGREYLRGLTRERRTPIKEIHDNQHEYMESWAIGYYNAPGATTLGKVWPAFGRPPAFEEATFPSGTVACKILFTDAGPNGFDKSKLPFMEGALEWTANIYPRQPYKSHATREECVPDYTVRENRSVYLLQIDFAVKDPDAANDWVFGTYMYDAGKNLTENSQPIDPKKYYDRFSYVGLMWGDDEKVYQLMRKRGAFVNADLKQTDLNEALIRNRQPASTSPKKAYMKYHGLGGRLNGPIDNPFSSCISCHARAAVVIADSSMRHKMGMFEDGIRITGEDDDYIGELTYDLFDNYFTDVKSGSYTSGPYAYFDYSLQLAFGIQNYFSHQKSKQEISLHSASVPTMPIEDPVVESLQGINIVDQPTPLETSTSAPFSK